MTSTEASEFAIFLLLQWTGFFIVAYLPLWYLRIFIFKR